MHISLRSKPYFIKAFVTCLLHEFEIELAWAQEFPKPSRKTYPGVSIVAPAEGVDLFVRLTERTRNVKR